MALEVKSEISNAHEEPIMCAAYNRHRREVYSGAQDGLIKVWEADSGKLVRTQAAHKGWVSDLLYNAFTKLLFSASVDGLLIVWSEKGKELQEVEFGGGGGGGSPIFCLAWNQKRKQIVAGGRGMICIYRVSTKLDMVEIDRTFAGADVLDSGGKDGLKVLKFVCKVESHTDLVRGLCCSESGKLFSAGYDKAICMYDSERPKDSYQRFENCHEGAICSVAFDTDNNWLITGSYDGSVKIWSQEGRCLDVFEGMCDTVTGVCYVPSTKNYWITGKSRKLVAFDPREPTDITPYVQETSSFGEYAIQKLHQAPGTDVVIGMTAQRQLVLWRYNPSAAHRVLNGHRDWVECLTVVRRDEDGGTPNVFSAGSDGLIFRWQPNSELNTDLYTCQDQLSGHEASIMCITYSDELDMLVTGSEDTTIRLWPLAQQVVEPDTDEEDLLVLAGHEGRVTGLACCGEHVLASVSHDMTMRFWDLHTKHEIECIEHAHDAPIHTLEFAELREELATAASEPIVKIWCSFKHKLKHVLSGHYGEVVSVKWCMFKLCWITAGEDGTIRLWDTDGVQQKEVTYRGECITTMLVDETNERLLAAMTDRAVRVYNLSSGELEQVGKYTGHTDILRSLVFVEEKAQYLSCSWDKSIRVWGTGTGSATPALAATAAAKAAGAGDDFDDENYVSSYEQKNPLVVPRALRANTRPAFKLLPQKAPPAKGKAEASGASEEDTPDSRTQLGRRLAELETKLAQRLGGPEAGARVGGAPRRVPGPPGPRRR